MSICRSLVEQRKREEKKFGNQGNVEEIKEK
jgi:hypothetical protein